jgi:hypothetical protein
MYEIHKNDRSDEAHKSYEKHCASSAWGYTSSNPLKPGNYHQTKVWNNPCMGLVKNPEKA